MLGVGGKALEAEGTANVIAWRQEWVSRGAAGGQPGRSVVNKGE